MKNTVYTYPERVIDSIQARDYTAIYYGDLSSIVQNKSDMFEYIEVHDDEHIENLAYELYDNESQSDTILATNGEVFLWNMPYNSDVLFELQDFYKRYLTKELNIGNGDARVTDFEQVLTDMTSYVELQNSDKRLFKIPKAKRLTDFVSVVDTYKIQNTVLDLDSGI